MRGEIVIVRCGLCAETCATHCAAHVERLGWFCAGCAPDASLLAVAVRRDVRALLAAKRYRERGAAFSRVLLGLELAGASPTIGTDA